MEKLLEVREVSDVLGLSEKVVRDKARAGELPALRVGREWRFDPVRLRTWIQAGGTAAAAATQDQS